MEATYLFELSYGNRVYDKEFVGSILDRYDNSKLVGANIIVNNNPYNFEFYFHLNFDGDTQEFDRWLETEYYSYFLNSRKYNFFFDEFLFSLQNRGYNIQGVLTKEMLEFDIPKGPNHIFVFPDAETLNSRFVGGFSEVINRDKVFISHSSKDKKIVDKLFNTLQKYEIRSFYDKHEIFPTDNIREVINHNLKNCKTGIICVSKNFNIEKSEWLKYEVEYFRTHNIQIIPVNVDLNKDEIKKVIGEIRYIDLSDEGITELVKVLKNQLEFKQSYKG
ncbi:toll/interleukin-1 receptor domain-containing protein [Priestia aryabhattai]|uniref:toll/interleukin-1 receptor domain-containing protein n=1 Tax=Priestia aryabhattai TaxID=412384 RepID=UPI003D7FB3D6